MNEFKKEPWIKKFMKGKGFYIALACCAFAIGIGTWYAVNGTAKAPLEDGHSVSQAAPATADTDALWNAANQAGANVTDVPDQRTSTTAASTTKQDTSMPQDEKHTPFKSYCMYPLGEAVLKPYSEEKMVFSKTMGDYRAHTGVDFSGERGAKVKAINDGIVRSVSSDALWGKVVEIDHGGQMVAKYCGLNNVKVKKGDAVKIGDVIGELGEIPVEAADGAHLHLEITVKGKIADPLKAMAKGQESETTTARP